MCLFGSRSCLRDFTHILGWGRSWSKGLTKINACGMITTGAAPALNGGAGGARMGRGVRAARGGERGTCVFSSIYVCLGHPCVACALVFDSGRVAGRLIQCHPSTHPPIPSHNATTTVSHASRRAGGGMGGGPAAHGPDHAPCPPHDAPPAARHDAAPHAPLPPARDRGAVG